MNLLAVVVSYRNSTSNHNSGGSSVAPGRLYLIEILHQTTTCSKLLWLFAGCILSKFYIKPQPSNRSRNGRQRCILSKFYIKPQLSTDSERINAGCILSKFYIKPQPMDDKECLRNVVSYRNSTSNHNGRLSNEDIREVVSYRNSTSNHNPIGDHSTAPSLYLIEILHQTTTR